MCTARYMYWLVGYILKRVNKAKAGSVCILFTFTALVTCFCDFLVYHIKRCSCNLFKLLKCSKIVFFKLEHALNHLKDMLKPVFCNAPCLVSQNSKTGQGWEFASLTKFQAINAASATKQYWKLLPWNIRMVMLFLIEILKRVGNIEIISKTE